MDYRIYYEKQCPICEKDYTTPIANKIYCSRECYNKMKRADSPIYKKVCLICNSTFETTRPSQLYCSEKCGVKAKNDRIKREYGTDKFINTKATLMERRVANSAVDRKYLKFLYTVNTCSYCHCKLNNKTRSIDHIIAVANGGKNNNENLTTCCRKCNFTKSSHPVEDFIKTYNYTFTPPIYQN